MRKERGHTYRESARGQCRLFIWKPHFWPHPSHFTPFLITVSSPLLLLHLLSLFITSLFPSSLFTPALICRWAAAVGHHDTHSCRGEECTTNWPSFFSVSACVLTCVWLFCSGCVSHFEWLPVRACFKAPEPNRFPSLSPSLPPPPRCVSALCSPAAIQFRWTPTGIQLKFLPNNQLNTKRQTDCLQSSSALCQSGGHKSQKNLLYTLQSFQHLFSWIIFSPVFKYTSTMQLPCT